MNKVILLILSFLSQATVFGSPDSVVAALFGIGGGGEVGSYKKYDYEMNDIRVEFSVYKLPKERFVYLRTGPYFGAELNTLMFRPFAGLSEMLLGIHSKGRVPYFYVGVSAAILAEVSDQKAYHGDIGAEVSCWIGTILGTAQVTQRTLVQNIYQTKLEYLIKIPFFPDHR